MRYYSLPPASSGMPAAGQQALAVQLERVTVPRQVERTQIVVRQTGNELVILDTQWWADNLAEEIGSALDSHLNAKAAQGRKTLLRVDVQRFELVPGPKRSTGYDRAYPPCFA
ncbi:membrane integrity-associated transporter subunit PqiC [Pseudomonas sp. v388]|uniref:PqiC family protein n=1 Tax=Pseudomonas sp. v388 TaxID=2479849 RepID=UPI0013155382|nr:ABC-type transport auxiliary lipoprotein family protein [Pseudomonas sp. v388]